MPVPGCPVPGSPVPGPPVPGPPVPGPPVPGSPVPGPPPGAGRNSTSKFKQNRQCKKRLDLKFLRVNKISNFFLQIFMQIENILKLQIEQEYETSNFLHDFQRIFSTQKFEI